MRYVRAYSLSVLRLVPALVALSVLFVLLKEHSIHGFPKTLEWAFDPLQEIRPDLGDANLTQLHLSD
jgi:hypothetical protein